MIPKKVYKNFILIMLFASIIALLVSIISIDTEAKSAYNTYMSQYLKNYKAKKYKTAMSYTNKMKIIKDTSIKKMSKKQKKAYRKKVNQYKYSRANKDLKKGYLVGYYLADLDGDKNAELLVKHGFSEADFDTEIFTYKKGKVVKVATEYSGHINYVPYPGKGVVTISACMGYCKVGVMSMKKGKIKNISYGEQKNATEYCIPRNYLYGHMIDSNYGLVDFSDLK